MSKQRILVTGATGNIGTSLISRLIDDERVDSIVGIARREPPLVQSKVEYVAADVARSDLVGLMDGVDAVFHLAWQIQPAHFLGSLWETNVVGSKRVFDAVGEAGVPSLVYASSVGAYGPSPDKPLVDESWPVDGVASSFYSRHKAEVECVLDSFERNQNGTRVIRVRPALAFKREAAAGIRRLFLGRLIPAAAYRPGRWLIRPHIRNLIFQVIHTDDLADAMVRLHFGGSSGAFNVATNPVVDREVLADVFGGRPFEIHPRIVRAVIGASFAARLQPTPPGWLDLALMSPLMDTARLRSEISWEPRSGADATVRELMTGLADDAAGPTAPLRGKVDYLAPRRPAEEVWNPTGEGTGSA